jgi:hypothetical protein
MRGEILAVGDTWKQMRVYWDGIKEKKPDIELHVNKEMVDGKERLVIREWIEGYQC